MVRDTKLLLIALVVSLSTMLAVNAFDRPNYWEDISKPYIGNTYYSVIRTRTPEGWLVVVSKPGSGITSSYVPDAAHIWSAQ